MKIKGILILILIAACLLSGCGSQSDDIPVLLNSIAGQMDLATVERKDLYDITQYDAMLSPVTNGVSVESSVILKEILVSLGDEVKKGDVLAVFNEEENTEVPNESILTNAEYELLVLDIQILEQYIKSLGIPSNETEQQELEYRQLELAELKLQLKYSGLEETKTETDPATDPTTDGATDAVIDAATENTGASTEEARITEVIAPCDGVIVYKTDAITGEKIPAYSLLFTIAENTTVIKSEYIAEETLLSADEIYVVYNNTKHSVFDTEERSCTRLYDSDGSLSTVFQPEWCTKVLPGTYIPVSVISNTHANVLCVPVDCIRLDDIGYFVFVVTGDTRERRTVEIGLITAAYVEITSGVQEGEHILVTE